MTARLQQPRSLAYARLRVCERFRLAPPEFHAHDYATQVAWLAYEFLREAEDAAGHAG